ncbi:serine/threonine protein kinase [Candidatus Saganbacteria bacterium]|nr:serine/threonine protein kinase [Candidatus Saganbacteria bacterium]
MSIGEIASRRAPVSHTRSWSLLTSKTRNLLPQNPASHSIPRVDERAQTHLLEKVNEPHFPFLMRGDTFGDFMIERKLGQGGYGAVYLAHSANLGTVALKISSVDMTAEAFAHAIASGRAYLGLVESLESGTQQDPTHEVYHYLAIKYVAGPTLELLASRGPLPAKRAAKIVERVARAAGEMHSAGLVHSDIKPSNVVMKSRDKIALLDYGLAKRWPVPEPVDGIVRGTPSYMAPEQLLAESFGPAADVFSMGVMLWELLTGQRAKGNRRYQVANLGKEYRTLPPLPSHLPPRYQEIIDKATALCPENRYADGHDLARALAEA